MTDYVHNGRILVPIIITAPRKRPVPIASEAWYARHSCCPKCGHDDIQMTCIGVIALPGRAFKDHANNAQCCRIGCRWRGKVKDCVRPKPKRTSRRRGGPASRASETEAAPTKRK